MKLTRGICRACSRILSLSAVFIVLAPAGGRGVDGNVDDLGVRQPIVDHSDELREIGRDLLWQPTAVNVVAAGAEEDLLGLVGKDDAIGEVGGVDNFGPAESSVDNLMVREVRCECLPKPDGRRAGEHRPALGRRVGSIGGFVRRNFFFPSGEVVRRGGRGPLTSRRSVLAGCLVTGPR